MLNRRKRRVLGSKRTNEAEVSVASASERTVRVIGTGGVAVGRAGGEREERGGGGRKGVIGSLEVAFRVDRGDLDSLTRRKPPGGGPSGG